MRAAISVGFIAMGCDRTRSPKASQEISQFIPCATVPRRRPAGSNHLLWYRHGEREFRRPARAQGRHAVSWGPRSAERHGICQIRPVQLAL